MVAKKTKKVVASAAATFGVAMAAVYVAPEINADILDITWNGGNATASNANFTASVLTPQDVDQVPNGILTTSLGNMYSIADFIQWNDSYGGVGRTIPLYTSAVMGGPESMLVVQAGDVIDPNTFVGAQTSLGLAPAAIGGTEFDSSGSAFVAIRPRVDPNTLYWFRMEFGGVFTPIVYMEGQYGSMGEALTVGGGDDPTCMVGDVDGSGTVDLLDVGPFVDAILDGTFLCEADANLDGVVDLLDVGAFVDLILGG